jgi:hypothetical protein
MAELVSCQDNDLECPLCGRSKNQTTFCKEVVQAVGSYNYVMDAREQETHEISS